MIMLYVWGICLTFGAGFFIALAGGSVGVILTATLLGSLYTVIGAIFFALSSGPHTYSIVSTTVSVYLPPLTWSFAVDQLSVLFLVITGVFAFLVAVYCFGALELPQLRAYARGIAGGYSLFVGATLLVVLSADLVTLIVSLEMSTLAFGYLSMYRQRLFRDGGAHPHDANESHSAMIAPPVYMAVSHLSTILLLLALTLLAVNAQDLSFAAWRSHALSLADRGRLAPVIFLLAFTGISVRIGLLPFHFWVPLVHPASPTPTHAFSLGVAIKVGIYVLLRVGFEFLPPEPLWGALVLLTGGGTALASVWYALASRDLKTALAYHSVENIAIIVTGVGVALLVRSMVELRWVGHLALVAALFHLVNHAIFKGLLYLCTGAISAQTGQEVYLDRLGGILQRFALTGWCFLIGAAAICGLPPLNGFVSEWLTLQALIGAARSLVLTGADGVYLMPAVVVVSLLLICTSLALTVICFVKIIGLTLLGAPRCPNADEPGRRTIGLTMGAPMAALATLCVLIGIAPGGVQSVLVSVADQLMPATLAPQKWMPNDLTLPLESRVWPILLLMGTWFGSGIVMRRVREHQPRRQVAAWNSGVGPDDLSYNEATGAQLSYTVRSSLGSIFPTGWLGRTITPKVERTHDLTDTIPAFMPLAEGRQQMIELVRWAINYMIAALVGWSRRFGEWLQSGSLPWYLGLIMATVTLLLVLFLISLN